jgi:hypothetical protein
VNLYEIEVGWSRKGKADDTFYLVALDDALAEAAEYWEDGDGATSVVVYEVTLPQELTAAFALQLITNDKWDTDRREIWRDGKEAK